MQRYRVEIESGCVSACHNSDYVFALKMAENVEIHWLTFGALYHHSSLCMHQHIYIWKAHVQSDRLLLLLLMPMLTVLQNPGVWWDKPTWTSHHHHTIHITIKPFTKTWNILAIIFLFTVLYNRMHQAIVQYNSSEACRHIRILFGSQF